VPTATPGFTIERIPSVLDVHEFNWLTFTDIRIPAAYLLGPENDAWRAIREALAHERIGGLRYARATLVTRPLTELVGARGWWDRDGIRTRLLGAEAACKARDCLSTRRLTPAPRAAAGPGPASARAGPDVRGAQPHAGIRAARLRDAP
jgi:hypothetical protein